MLLVSGNEKSRRLSICQKCEFFKPSTQSCGTLVVGERIVYKGLKAKLCGCVMPIKASLKTASCPVGKWDALISPDDVEHLRKVLEDVGEIRPNSILSESQQHTILVMYNRLTNQNQGFTRCAACWRNWIEDLRRILKEADEIDSIEKKD